MNYITNKNHYQSMHNKQCKNRGVKFPAISLGVYITFAKMLLSYLERDGVMCIIIIGASKIKHVMESVAIIASTHFTNEVIFKSKYITYECI